MDKTLGARSHNRVMKYTLYFKAGQEKIKQNSLRIGAPPLQCVLHINQNFSEISLRIYKVLNHKDQFFPFILTLVI